MKKLKFVPVWFFAVFLVLSGCVGSEAGKASGTGSLTIMTWNIHNLFDGKDDGGEYVEFRQSAGWSTEKYLGRINDISAAISQIEPRPDIVLFQEIESLKILEDLALAMPQGYLWAHFANNPGSPVGLGILSRFPLIEVQAHSININGDTIPRPVLETRVQTKEADFVIFSCHWKSKIGGVEATEKTRMAAARVVVRRIRELLENEIQTGIIVAGDLNLNHDEFYRRDSSVICSLLPDAPYAAQLAGAQQKDFIVISGNMPPEPVYFPQGTIVLYSPWMGDMDVGLSENGSYFFRNNWETIDHFLISRQFFDNFGWEYERTIVADFEPFTNSRGTPNSYNPRTGQGLSDHLPLLMTLKTGILINE